jgi:hypothetical protein
MFHSIKKWIVSAGILAGFIFIVFQPACNQKSDQKQEQTEQQVTQQEETKSRQRQQNQANNQPPTKMQKQATNIEVSDSDLKSFAKLQEDLISIRKDAREKMINAIEDKGIDLQKFNKISKQMRNAKSMNDIDASEAEVQKVQEASRSVRKIQQSIQQEQKKVINEQEMTVERFQKIQQATMQDPELQQRVREMMKD